MPYHADAAVALLASGHRRSLIATLLFFAEALCFAPALRRDGRADGFFQRDSDGVELVIARHLFGQLTCAGILEHEEISQEIEKPAFFEHAF